VLAPIAAANISAMPIETTQPTTGLYGDRLDSLKPGEQAKVVGLSPRSRGPERRRLLDLGILSGTVISAELSSPGGDPIAYRIRGALIALRKEQAQLIHITDRQEVPA
jgi:DtxR family Mn-dependent transcriptional regulator